MNFCIYLFPSFEQAGDAYSLHLDIKERKLKNYPICHNQFTCIQYAGDLFYNSINLTSSIVLISQNSHLKQISADLFSSLLPLWILYKYKLAQILGM